MNHVMDVKIYYEDTDCGGVVYYANYLRYMERARTEYLASRGYAVKKLMDEGTIFMVLRVEIDYRSPARYGDTIVLQAGGVYQTPNSFRKSGSYASRNGS